MKRTVCIGFLGTVLDAGKGPERWEKWRPTVSLFQHEDLLIHRLELFHDARHDKTIKRLTADIGQVSPETEVRPRLMPLDDPWDFEEVYSALHDFALTYPFEPESEDYLMHLTTGTHVAQICMFLLTEARYLPGRLLQASPPRKNQSGPGRYSIVDLDLSRYDRIAARFQAEKQEATSFLKSGIPTRNEAFNRMIDQIEQVAIRTRAPVLLMGPTGAGKSQLARRIFELKKLRHRIAGAFVEVNCATLRGATAMSALFGHRKGAFTGAQTDRPGLLRTADGGVLFLDEIGDLGLDEQAMILRAIEEGCFLPVGADQEVRSDFQLIAGTNRDLTAEVAEGRFREDLFARLNLWTFRLPGLNDRPEDLEPNLDYELARFAETQGARVTFNKEARERFLAFAAGPEALWSGNFRDLAGSVTRMATFATSGRIGEEAVRAEIARLRALWRPPPGAQPDKLLRDLLGAESLDEIDPFDRPQLAEVVRVCRLSPNLSTAGRALFAASRRRKKSSNDADRLRKYLARFGLDWDQVRGAVVEV